MSTRTTGGPEVAGERDRPISPPTRSNIYEAIKQTETSRRTASSTQTLKKPHVASYKTTGASARSFAARGSHQEDVEFGTEDDLVTPAPAPSSKAAYARKPAPSSSARMHSSARKEDASRQPPADGTMMQSRSSRSGRVGKSSPSSFETKKSGHANPGRERMSMNDTRPARVVRPGAERVGGEDTSTLTPLTNLSAYRSDPPNFDTGVPPDDLLDAELVDPAAVDRQVAERQAQEKKNAPLAGVLQEGPWYQRRAFLGSLVAFVVVVVIIAIVAATTSKKNSGGGPSVPTDAPTSSPAPTALALITAVVQMDSKPAETGWELSCDSETLMKADPGTYALVEGRPNFRIEYEVETTVGAECQLKLTDIGGDGLNPGLYEVYLGKNVGDRSALIDGGTIHGSESIITFEVRGSIDANETSPASSPTVSATVTTEGCSICPDGAPVLFPEAQGLGSLTCEQLESLAASSNETECKKIQDSSATMCGCRNYCSTMCPDGVSGPDPSKYQTIAFIENDRQVSCGEYQARVTSSRSNSVDECLSANFLGEDVCGCPKTETFCRICEPTPDNNSTHNPPLEALEKEIVPGVSCRDITGIAYTLKKADPSGIFARLCPACLAIGGYCGCEIPPDGREFCRLCGGRDTLLPEPARLVDSKVLGKTTTCYHVEFASNVNDPSTLPCEVYQQDASYHCCFD